MRRPEQVSLSCLLYSINHIPRFRKTKSWSVEGTQISTEAADRHQVFSELNSPISCVDGSVDASSSPWLRKYY